MDWVYQYRDPEKLYLNVTNRCTNRCAFCVRSQTARLGNGLLLGDDEPDLEELLEAVERKGGAGRFSEIVWCGYGEPTIRLDLILAASPVFRASGAEVRLNTNGHACLIHDREVLPELGAVIDRVNVSLNAPNVERYLELCRPDPGTVAVLPSPTPRRFWEAMIDFLRHAAEHIDGVQASVVGHVLSDEEIKACREMVTSISAAPLRVR